MSFNHMLVTTLLRDTKSYMAQRANSIDTTDPRTEQHAARVLRTVDDVDGVSVKTAELCEAVRSELRGIKFAFARRGSKTVWDGSLSKLMALWAYYPGDEYAVGLVGFGDFAVSTSDDVYAVYARGIRNEKFADHRDQYHMAMSSSMDRAVKNAKKYLRRYSTVEVADLNLGDIQTKINSAVWTTSSQYREAQKAVFEHPMVETEIERVLNGSTFCDPTFRQAAATLMAVRDEHKARSEKEHHGWYVNLRHYPAGVVFEVLEMYDIRRLKDASQCKLTSYRQEELPQELAASLATLSMLENGNYVEGLGIKLSDVSYMVLK